MAARSPSVEVLSHPRPEPCLLASPTSHGHRSCGRQEPAEKLQSREAGTGWRFGKSRARGASRAAARHPPGVAPPASLTKLLIFSPEKCTSGPGRALNLRGGTRVLMREGGQAGKAPLPFFLIYLLYVLRRASPSCPGWT